MKKYKLIKEYPGSPSVGATTGGFNDANNIYYNIYMGDFLGTRIHRFYIENFPEFWQELKEPLFTTEDGVDIYMDDSYWSVGTTFNTCELKGNNLSGKTSTFKYFSTRAKALDYISMNKPRYSEKDIEIAFEKFAKDAHKEACSCNVNLDISWLTNLFFDKLTDGKEVKQG